MAFVYQSQARADPSPTRSVSTLFASLCAPWKESLSPINGDFWVHAFLLVFNKDRIYGRLLQYLTV